MTSQSEARKRRRYTLEQPVDPFAEAAKPSNITATSVGLSNEEFDKLTKEAIEIVKKRVREEVDRIEAPHAPSVASSRQPQAVHKS